VNLSATKPNKVDPRAARAAHIMCVYVCDARGAGGRGGRRNGKRAHNSLQKLLTSANTLKTDALHHDENGRSRGDLDVDGARV
jgi:hypothetical protein